MSESQYVRPSTIDQALAVRAAHPDWMLLAGGTDLLVGAHRQKSPVGIIDIFGLNELVGVEQRSDGTLVIGAATTYQELLASGLVHEHLGCLAAAAREVGALQIQSRGTLGGNIGTSSPVGDSLPALLALDATLELGSARGRRTVAYADYCIGYRATLLADDELILTVRFPAVRTGTIQRWRKVGTRRAQSISKVAMAAVAHFSGGVYDHARIAFAAVADRPVRLASVEDLLMGQAPSDDLAVAAAAAVSAAIKPIDDIRSRSKYRMRVAQNLVARFVRDAFERG